MCISLPTRVGDHDECAVGAVLDDLRDDGFEDVHVPLHQVEAALPLLLTDARRHHHQSGVGSHRVVWRNSRRGDGGVAEMPGQAITDALSHLCQQLFWRSLGKGCHAGGPSSPPSDGPPSHPLEPTHPPSPEFNSIEFIFICIYSCLLQSLRSEYKVGYCCQNSSIAIVSYPQQDANGTGHAHLAHPHHRHLVPRGLRAATCQRADELLQHGGHDAADRHMRLNILNRHCSRAGSSRDL